MKSRILFSNVKVTPADPSNADLLKVIKEMFQKVEEGFQKVENGLTNLEFAQYPMLDDRVCSVPLIGGKSDQLTDPRKKKATYTWFEYAPGVNCLVGSAHCAITLALPFDNVLFLELPPEITSLGIESIYLIDPYDADFVNPLPIERDLIVIRVKASPPTGKSLPKFSSFTPDKAEQQRYCRVVGQALGSIVSSHAGIHISESNDHSGGNLQFLLDLGDPTDSGTLLHVKDKEGNLHARAVFCGVMPRPSHNYSRRGQGAILPDPKCLTRLPVVAHTEIPHGTKVHVRCFNNNNSVSDITCDIVPKRQLGENAIELKDPNGYVKQGLLVKSLQPINYIGEMDHCRMSGHII